MEVRVYSPELQLIGIVGNYISLIWNRKYSSAGSFELHLPATDENIRYLQRGNVIAYRGAVEAGIIESLLIHQDSAKNELTAKGRFLESYLDRRVIHGEKLGDYSYASYTYTDDYTEKAMRQLITTFADFPLLELGEEKGFTDKITFQATFQNLLKYEGKLADSANLGFRCLPDFANKKIIFDIYKGVDHSENQSERARVTFSDEYRNLSSSDYTENDQLLKTVCYVGGQGDGSDRVWVSVGDTSETGIERREVKLDATDINPENMTDAEYRAQLEERGRALLENTDILVKSFESKTIPNGNFKYKEHYDLGDIVTIKKTNWNVATDLRITEITETYEHGKQEILPTFGNPLPTTIDWEDK